MSRTISNRERATLEGFGFSTVKASRKVRRERDLRRKSDSRRKDSRSKDSRDDS